MTARSVGLSYRSIEAYLPELFLEGANLPELFLDGAMNLSWCLLCTSIEKDAYFPDPLTVGSIALSRGFFSESSEANLPDELTLISRITASCGTVAPAYETIGSRVLRCAPICNPLPGELRGEFQGE
jgi:hypothetical protein